MEETGKITIKTTRPDAFSIHTVAGDPRSCSPADLKAACDNVSIEFSPQPQSREVVALFSFLYQEFFPLAHRTGLYNRQQALWQSIARVCTAEYSTVRAGWLFFQEPLPVLDVTMSDASDRPIILARLVKHSEESALSDEKAHVSYMRSFVKRIGKMQLARQSLAGAFLLYQAPVDEAVINAVGKLVDGDDPVGKWESRLAPPADATINILEAEYSEQETDSNAGEVRLVFPELPERVSQRSG